MRILPLDGDQGTVLCRIHNTLQSNPVPSRSQNGTLECSTRTYLRLRNLVAVRGQLFSQAYMIGPCDYMGNLEDPCQKWYVIKDNQFVEVKQPTTETKVYSPQTGLCVLPDQARLLVMGRWVTQTVERINHAKSLFPTAGTFWCSVKTLNFPYFDARTYDLSTFHARLVNHALPFQVATHHVPHADEFRVITYEYGKTYAQQNSENIFLEKHTFSQTITPLNATCSGFVVLAKPVAEHTGPSIGWHPTGPSIGWHMIAVHIPYGYTLLIEPNCVHGDATLTGMFMMAMTSNHVTMQTADTVFLRHTGTGQSLRMTRGSPK